MAVTLNASTSSGLVQTADTSGTIELQSNGTTKATVSSSGLAIGQYNPSSSLITSGTAVASTSGTSIDFTSIPSWVKRVTVMFDAVSTNGTSLLLVRLGTSSGVETTGYLSGAAQSASGVGYSFSTVGFVISVGANTTAASSYNGALILTNLNSNIWVGNGSLYEPNWTVGNFMSGSKTLAGTLDRVRITTTNGTDTFDAGSINILYE
jgi:hypothetical protein